MKKEDKKLLIKDLCSRLPYKPIVQIEGCGVWNLRGIDHDDSAELRDRVIVWHGKNYPSSKNSFPIINCKPYLFPLSSMTEEQKKEYNRRKHDIQLVDELGEVVKEVGLFDSPESFEYLIENHFDYHGLIPMGLAIDATNLNVY